jgi:hypothetical protein
LKGKKKIGVSGAPQQVTPTKTLYFGPEVQDSITKFCLEKDEIEKEKIYLEEIMPAFNKLVENLIYIYGFAKWFDNVHEVKSDCVCFLYENMHKFKPEKGTKAFSYFNVVARNWLINNSKRKYKDDTRNVSIDDTSRLTSSDKTAISYHSIVQSPDEILIDKDRKRRILVALETIEKNLNEPHELAILSALRIVFQKSDEIDLLSKRAVFLYIREISGVSHKQMSTVMTSLRKKYRELNSKGEGIF